MRGCYDLERSLQRLYLFRGGPRDLGKDLFRFSLRFRFCITNGQEDPEYTRYHQETS